MALDLDLPAVNTYLENITASDRIKWARDTSPNLLLSTSGGEKYSLLPHLMRSVLGEQICPLLFIDTGYYPPSTLDAISWLKRAGYDVRTYASSHSPNEDIEFFGRDFQDPNTPFFKDWVERRKHEPTKRALNDIRPDIWIGGRMRSQQASRIDISFLQRKGDVFQFNPLADWSRDDAWNYLKTHNLPSNPHHKDVTKDVNGECRMWTYDV